MTADWRLTAPALFVAALLSTPARAALTEGPRLGAIYDTILDARFDVVAADLQKACPPAPVGACRVLAAVSIWWEINIDSDDRRLDAAFNEAAAAAIAATTDWTRREPARGEAWFYLAGAYAPLVQWRILRGERLAAARDGVRIKGALERALELDPTLHDAWYGIGLYHYYADVASLTAKFLRWLFLLPGGDRAQGLKEMLEARQYGELLKGEADYQLQQIDFWYEHQPRRGLEMLESLAQRYPNNPLFLQRMAEAQDEYFHDVPASAAAWQRLLDRAQHGGVAHAPSAEARARLALAAQLDAMDETDRAIDQLLAVRDARPSRPPDARARAELQLGMAYDRIDQRNLAVEAYRAALQLIPAGDPTHLTARVRAGLRQAPGPQTAAAYRAALEGWRALASGDLERADRLLGSAVTRAPDDMVTRYRYARVLEARGDYARARTELERVTQARPVPPAFIMAAAYLARARLLERDGDRGGARTLYRMASEAVGGDSASREEARSALARLTAP